MWQTGSTDSSSRMRLASRPMSGTCFLLDHVQPCTFHATNKGGRRRGLSPHRSSQRDLRARSRRIAPGSRHGFGALLVGHYENGNDLRYAGKAGTGFDDAELESLGKRLKALERAQSPFLGNVKDKLAHFVRPEPVGDSASPSGQEKEGFAIRASRGCGWTRNPGTCAGNDRGLSMSMSILSYGEIKVEISNDDKIFCLMWSSPRETSSTTTSELLISFSRSSRIDQKQAGEHFPSWLSTARVDLRGAATP